MTPSRAGCLCIPLILRQVSQKLGLILLFPSMSLAPTISQFPVSWPSYGVRRSTQVLSLLSLKTGTCLSSYEDRIHQQAEG